MALTQDDVLALGSDSREELRRRFDPFTWATETAHISLPKTGLLTMEGRPFLRDVFRDTHPDIVVLKGAQLGFSTTAVVRTFWFVTTFASSAIYTFPTGKDVTRFTKSRINPLITGSRYLQDRIVNVNSVGEKQFVVWPHEHMPRNRWDKPDVPPGTPRSMLYLSGASSEKEAASIDADLLVHDEEDLADPDIIEQFESRLDASRFKWKFRLSTPRLPGAGIDRVWKETDQRKWLVTCSRCKAEFEMAFPGGPWDYGNIDPDPTGWSRDRWERWERDGMVARYVCHRCGRTLSDDDRANGRWTVTQPTRTAHGYSVSQMAALWVPASRILERRMKSTWESNFWNLVMGVPWEEGTSAMTREAILARQDETRPMAVSGIGTFMGVDVGLKMDVVIDIYDQGRPRTVHMGRYDTFDDLDRLMAVFGVATCVIDSAPEDHKTREFADQYNDYASATPNVRVWRCSYGSSPKGPQVVWNEKQGTVAAPRTEILSKSSDELLTERVLPRYDRSDAWEAYLTHHWNSKRVPMFVEGLESQQVLAGYRWVEVGPDHMFHAGTYAMLARMAPRTNRPPTIGLVSLKRSATRPPPDAPVYLPTGIRQLSHPKG